MIPQFKFELDDEMLLLVNLLYSKSQDKLHIIASMSIYYDDKMVRLWDMDMKKLCTSSLSELAFCRRDY